jgi:hypothetical protein
MSIVAIVSVQTNPPTDRHLSQGCRIGIRCRHSRAPPCHRRTSDGAGASLSRAVAQSVAMRHEVGELKAPTSVNPIQPRWQQDASVSILRILDNTARLRTPCPTGVPILDRSITGRPCPWCPMTPPRLGVAYLPDGGTICDHRRRQSGWPSGRPSSLAHSLSIASRISWC